jgi:hypothetical protein
MKRSILFFTWAILSTSAIYAQIDIKVGPLGLLFNNFNMGVEVGASPNVGIELTGGADWKRLPLVSDNIYKGSALRLGINGRYYFNPTEKKLNGFYAGAYTRFGGGKYSFTNPDTNEKDEFKSTRVAGGFLIGGKIVSKNERIIFDLGIGFGRAFVYKFEDLNGTNEADLTDVPFVNFDLPINLKIGYRIGVDNKK